MAKKKNDGLLVLGLLGLAWAVSRRKGSSSNPFEQNAGGKSGFQAIADVIGLPESGTNGSALPGIISADEDIGFNNPIAAPTSSQGVVTSSPSTVFVNTATGQVSTSSDRLPTFGITNQPISQPSQGPVATPANVGVAARAGFQVHYDRSGRATVKAPKGLSAQTTGQLARGGFLVEFDNTDDRESSRSTQSQETSRAAKATGSQTTNRSRNRDFSVDRIGPAAGRNTRTDLGPAGAPEDF